MTRDCYLDEKLGLMVRRCGVTGPKILWIHGYTIDSSLWQKLWHLMPGWQHLGFDLPGHGQSPRGSLASLSDLAGQIGQFALDEEVEHMVALSLGTTIALQVALDHPTHFETVTLGAPAIGGGPADQDVGNLYRELRQMRIALGSGPWLAERWMMSPPDLFTWARKNPNVWPDIERVVHNHGWHELASFEIGSLANHHQPSHTISAIESRMLLLIGEHELPAFVETSEIILRESIDCRRHVLDGVGHLCMLEAPLASARLIDAHLR